MVSSIDQQTTIKKALSARTIDKMKIGDSDKSDIGEYAGLRIHCGKTGMKTFFYRYRSPLDNLIKQFKIGTYPHISLAEARLELIRLKVERSQGICPKQKKEQEKIQQQIEQDDAEKKSSQLTIKEMIDMYLMEVIEDHWVNDGRTDEKKKVLGVRKPKGQAETRRTLYGDAVRVLGNHEALEVTRKDIVNLIKEIIDRGSNVQAGRVLSELTLAYEYAIGLERFPDNFANPALLAKMSIRQTRLKITSKKGVRVLNDQELKLLLNWLPKSGFTTHQKNVLFLTLWTGCRTGELCEAKISDFDLKNSTWHLRDSKNGAERYVQLSRQCVDFLKTLYKPEQEYLFASSRTGLPIQQKSLTEMKWQLKNPHKTRNKYRPEQMWLDRFDDWNPHDLRRTVRTGLSRLGCPSEIAEAVLGHSKKGIEGTYNLHKYESECAEWLQKWADYLDEILKGA
ncbi:MULTISPECIES: tyrosine-type recombinase/integrase [Acinetobacter]|uniref:tyrosine-type recombinase/integrase n=1 Tax=Acinetobacter TaxID=469 RepID=UPI00141A765D|nr:MULTISPECIES: site-specific integrase [Acinetobacter]MCS4297148.1 integrase [Acinetobacter guillouiae]MCW2250171.1 integrase [Acinetobacter sp. BIGb0204]NII39275.1 integrase [Acinetobacter sp. BIGb0196]